MFVILFDIVTIHGGVSLSIWAYSFNNSVFQSYLSHILVK